MLVTLVMLIMMVVISELVLVKVDKHCSTGVIQCEGNLSIWKGGMIVLPEIESGYVLQASVKWLY